METRNRRLLVVDDNIAIHDDFKKVLGQTDDKQDLADAEAALFGTTSDPEVRISFHIDGAYQGKQGLALLGKALSEGRPYAAAFIDIRMPPGWNGIETTQHMWNVDPDLQVVLCTAYSDNSWSDIIGQLGQTDRFLLLKKPFNNMEVRQLALALTEKWFFARQARLKMSDLEHRLQRRKEELEHQNRDLKEAVKNLQRAQSQLLQADKMASIGQLAAGVAHEINNPIGFISSNLNTLSHYVADIRTLFDAYERLLEQLPSDQVCTAQTIAQIITIREDISIDCVVTDINDLTGECIEGVKRVRQIVADLRDFSHVDTPDAGVEDINQLLEKTISVAWNELKYKTEIIREYGKIAPIPCYGGKLGQVFLNLLVNAAQAIDKHGAVTIRTTQTDMYVRVEIIDTGHGISPEDMKRIFDPFFTTKDVGKGTGLGLHMAYTIVQGHGGSITSKSTVGKGTTFRIDLPLTGPPNEQESESELAATY